MAAFAHNVSRSFQTVSRPLMTPDECQRLAGPEKNGMTGEIIKAGAMLIFTAGFAPIYGTQILYFKDPIFQARAALPAPQDTDRLLSTDSENWGEMAEW